ncbi:hypothetical protein CSKR_201398 [Clonorchis sinensis]|uniref:Uncharacterized protein n=1 Tax=Clonorchis sinensis TaxID=79923 RepID=A0A8T1MR60_CLOSI|nr:hypothetical protein CSKR_201398 [Clonorchis sinensis]
MFNFISECKLSTSQMIVGHRQCEQESPINRVDDRANRSSTILYAQVYDQHFYVEFMGSDYNRFKTAALRELSLSRWCHKNRNTRDILLGAI